jgi:hypothetical protein
VLLGRQQSFGAGGPVGRYWLSRCTGFSVRARDGETGRVEEVVFRSPVGPAAYVLVREDGLFGKRLAIAVEEVAEVDPWTRWLRLRGSFRACAKRTRRNLEARRLPLETGRAAGS